MQCLMNVKTYIFEKPCASSCQLAMPSISLIFIFHVMLDHLGVLCCHMGSSNTAQPFVLPEAKGVISFVSFYHKTDQLSYLIFLCDFKRWWTVRIPQGGCFLLSP